MKEIRWVVAALLAAAAVPLAVTGARWPLEAGSILFTPLLWGLAGVLLLAAVAVAPLRRRPRARRVPTAREQALWASLAAVAGVAQLVRWVS